MKKPFEILPNTANTRVKITGEDLAVLFSHAVTALGTLLKEVPHERRGKEVYFSLTLEAPDLETLLVNFLSDILAQGEMHHIVYTRVETCAVTEADDAAPARLHAQLAGYPAKEFDRHITAVSQHEVEIVQNGQGDFEAMLVFDIENGYDGK